jgi:quinol monooxygenase YgiN
MAEDVSWVFEVAIRPGALDNFRPLMEEMVKATFSDEPGTVTYEWFIADDGRSVHAYERYTDSSAVMTHVRNFGEKFAGRFLELAEVTGFTIYGNPSDEVRGALSAFGPTYLAALGGYAR